MDYRPIGVFDSGVGGLTVLKRLLEVLPGEDYIYFGDTKRVPYGDRSKEEIKKFADQIINFMKSKNTKAIVVACNTTCATINKKDYDEILFDVIDAGVESAINSTKNKKIGVIGTTRTIESKTYNQRIKLADNNIDVYGVACPDFVPLIEKGLYETKQAYETASKYLSNFTNKNIDTLILGCTHYSIMENVIHNIMGDDVKLIDPAIKLAENVRKFFETNKILNPNTKGNIEYFVSKDIDNFVKISERIIGSKIKDIKMIDIDKY